ncbi:MAG: glycosyltransferase family 4 protein [Saccharospirillum sp.]|nr:glycosyltransferase family 4 protein [Saccharospirillum sp.]
MNENVKHLLWAHIILFATNVRFIVPFICRLMGKRVVFYDAFQRLPNHPLKKLYFRLCISIADRCIFYSKNQLKIWKVQYPVLAQKGRAITYGIDSTFFSTSPEVQSKPVAERRTYVSIGRDPSRDFFVLANTFNGSERSLVLVTQDYMLNEKLKKSKNITIRSGLSYTELSELYDQAKASVIPILGGTSHLSGIRAAMEAMAKFVPVVITHNESLAEYFTGEDHVIYFSAGDSEALKDALNRLEQAPKISDMTEAAYSLVASKYSYQTMCNELLDAIDA